MGKVVGSKDRDNARGCSVTFSVTLSCRGGNDVWADLRGHRVPMSRSRARYCELLMSVNTDQQTSL